MKLSMRILMAVMVLTTCGWAAAQTDVQQQNQVNGVKVGKVVEIREVSKLKNLDELKEVDERQDKKVQLYRAADEVISVSVESGGDQVVYTLTLSNGDEKKIPVEQLADSPLVRSIKDLEELKEFDDLRTVTELKMTDGLIIIGPDSEQEKGTPAIYVTKSLEGGRYIAPAGQEEVEVVVFGKDSKERTFSVGCTVEPDQMYIEKIPVEEKTFDVLVIQPENGQGEKPQQRQSKTLRAIDEIYDEIEATHEKQHELMDQQRMAEAENRTVDEDLTRQLEELEQKYQQLWEKLRTSRDKGIVREKEETESQLVELKAELEALEDAAASQEKKAALKNEIKLVEEIITELQDFMDTRKRQEEARQEETKFVEALLSLRGQETQEQDRRIQNVQKVKETTRQQVQKQVEMQNNLEKLKAELDKLERTAQQKAQREALEKEINQLEELLVQKQEQKAVADQKNKLALQYYVDAVEATRALQTKPVAYDALNLVRSISPPARSGADFKIMVVPADEPITAGELALITENMQIMTRIFEKKLSTENLIESELSLARIGYLVSGAQSSDIESLYLQGFGALFLMKVDYPLLPPEEKVAPPPEKKDIDKVWDEVKKELKAPPPRRLGTSNFYGLVAAPSQRIAKSVKEYSERKVEELKDTILETLVHASNMGHVADDEFIVVHITGAARPVETVVKDELIDVKTDKTVDDLAVAGVVQISSGKGRNFVINGDLKGIEKIQTITLSGPSESKPTYLVIRAQKSDIINLAEEEITFDELKQKVSIIIYDGH